MIQRAFLAANSQGITRAERNGNGDWRVELPLNNQRINCLARDPGNSNAVYAGTQGNGVLLSEDRGLTWRQAGLAGQVVKSLTVSAQNSTEHSTLYAGTRPARVFVSHNGGDSWRELEGFGRIKGRWYWFSPAEPPFKAYVSGLAVSPTNPRLIVAGIEAGAVVRSQDGGQTWSGHRPGADRDCHTLTFHAHDGEWVYMGGGGGPAFSRDGGQTWKKPKSGMSGSYCWASAADPERPEIWYVSASRSFSFRHFAPQAHVDGQANAHIYRSTGGAAWEKLEGGLPQPLDYMAYGLLTDPTAPGHLYAGLSNGDVWHSIDYGDAWRKLDFNMGGIHRSLTMV